MFLEPLFTPPPSLCPSSFITAPVLVLPIPHPCTRPTLKAEHVRPPTHHKSQGGEEEAGNKLDVGAMAHDQPEAPKKGYWLSLLSLIGFWGPEETVRKERRPIPSLRPRQRNKARQCWGLHHSPVIPHLSAPSRPGSG